MVGIARYHQPRAIAARYRPPRRGARDACRNPRLVHRGLRARRPEGSQSAPRRAYRITVRSAAAGLPEKIASREFTGAKQHCGCPGGFTSLRRLAISQFPGARVAVGTFAPASERGQLIDSFWAFSKRPGFTR